MLFFCGINSSVSIAEEKRDTPECRKTDQSINDPADKGCLTSENPRNDVKAK